MKLSKISVYLLILAALAAWLYFVEIKQKDKKQADEDKASKIVNIEKDQIVQIDLKSGDGVNIELKKPDEWVITAPLNTRADQAAVGSLLLSATDARSEKIVLEKDVKWEEYGLEKPVFSVALTTKDGKTEILFGESNPSKTSYYVRIGGDPRLFLVSDTLKNSLNKPFFDLRDKTVITIAPEDVDRIQITQKDEETELKREEPEKWVMIRPEKMRVKNTVVNRDLNNLANLKAKQIIDEPNQQGNPYGLEKPEKSILLAGPKLEQTLLIGSPDHKEVSTTSEPAVYARIKGYDTVYLIDERSVKGLTQPDRNLLRDRSLFSFNPVDVDKLEIDLDGKKWVAVRSADKKWSLEQPQKIEGIDSWTLTSILWELKDLEWKTMTKGADGDLSSTHLDSPQLIITVFKKDEKEPLILKAGWSSSLQSSKKDSNGETTDKKEPAGTDKEETTEDRKSELKADPQVKTPPDTPGKPQVPELVNAMVEPHEEKGAIFAISSNFIVRLRSDLERIVGKQ
ncbi:MAG: DUF4340 domain-containing protein [Desulfomonile sp.]